MNTLNELKCTFPARSENESFARTMVCAFASQLDPTVEDLADLRTAVSEAVTNSIVHAYRGRDDGIISVTVRLLPRVLSIFVLPTRAAASRTSRRQ